MGRNDHTVASAVEWVKVLASLRLAYRLELLCTALVSLIVNFSSPALAHSRLFVTDFRGSTISVIDTSTNTVTASIPVGNHPIDVAITPDNMRAYVANYGNLDENASISVIDTTSNMTTATVSLTRRPSSVAIAPNGRFAYVPLYDPFNLTDVALAEIETSTNKIVGEVSLQGGVPSRVALTADGALVLVADALTGVLHVVDALNHELSADISVGYRAFDVVTSRTRRIAYAIDEGPALLSPPGLVGTLRVVDLTAGKVIDEVAVGVSPQAIALSADNRYLYVTNEESETLSVIDANSMVASTDAALGVRPRHIALAPDGEVAYVTTYNAVAVVDLTRNQVTAMIVAGDYLGGLALVDPPPAQASGASQSDGCSLAGAAGVWPVAQFVLPTALLLIGRLSARGPRETA